MKKLLYSGLTALMMLFAMVGVVRAQGEEGGGETPATVPAPSFANVGTVSVGDALQINWPTTGLENYYDYRFILYVENDEATELKWDGTMRELQSALYASQTQPGIGGWGLLAEGDDEDPVTPAFKIALYDADEEEWLPAVSLSETGTVKVRARLAVAANMNATVELSDEFDATYTVTGKVLTVPTFYIDNVAVNGSTMEVESGATLTFKNGYEEREDAQYYSILYVVDGTDADFEGLTMETMFNGTVQVYQNEDDAITIDNAQTIKAATAQASMDGSVTLSEIVTVAFTIAGTTPEPPVAEKVAAPTFDPVAGEVAANATVTIATTTQDATVYYRKGETGEYAAYTAPVAITEACTLYAFATKADMTNSDTVSAAYTIAVIPTLPADEEDAPVLTFTPANTDSVDNNTEILISGADGYSVEYATYESVSAALNGAMWDLNVYGAEGYPMVTAEEPILKVSLTNRTTMAEYEYYRAYMVRAASDVPMPQIVSEDVMAAEVGLYSKGGKVKIMADEVDAIWYTTDGSKPAIDGATSTKIDKVDESGAVGDYILNSSVNIKAIAVKDGKASDVASAHFKLYEDATTIVSLTRGMSPLDSIVGKNSPITVAFACEEAPSLSYMFPYTVYYTTDGTTEPDKDAYTEGGAIKKSESPMGEWGPEGNPSILIANESATTVKAKVYMHVGGEEMDMPELDEWIVSQTVSVTIDSIVYGLADPEFTVAGGEVRMGDTIRIKNLNPAPEVNEDEEESSQPSQIFFSVNGPLPSSDMTVLDPTVVYSTSDEEVEDVVIVIKEDEEGTYAYIPSNEKYYDGSDKIYFEGELKIQAICYDGVDYGVGMWGLPGRLEYGSNFVEATYMVEKDFPMPVITPNGGELAKDAEITITAGEGLDIYYTVNDSLPEVGKEYTKKYESPIKMAESMTLKAMAYKAGAEGERDSVSNVAVAEFRLQATLSFNPASGSTVEEGTKVAITASDNDVDIFYMMFESEEAAKAAEWNQEEAELYTGEMQPVLSKKYNTIKAAYARQNAEAIVDVYFYATYTVTERPAIELTFNPASGAEVADSTKVTITTSRELVGEEQILFAMFASKTEAENCSDEDIMNIVKVYGTPDPEDETIGYPMITKAAPVLKAGYIKGEDEEGNWIFSWTIAEYKVKEQQQGGDSTAVEGKELAGVSIYPNPTDGEFSVVAPANANVEIFNAAGVLVKRMTVAEGNVQVRLNNSGIYFVRVRANGQMAVKKVVIR
ncbi:MAG: chitobiase/beta-hexosaminidase C-terminal domain-containing protein [Bacteroidales bacterium]|nr:chitobiase/beta-hexosaminidase C-terminal domain-containing protein [Bacteroidales bacterium]